MKKTKDSYTNALEWAKKASIDTTMSQKVKDLAKRNADWAQKKYVALKNEIQIDEVEQEKAAAEVAKELNKKKEEEESAGIVLSTKEREELYKEIKDATEVKLTGDRATDDKLLNQQYEITTNIALGYKDQMYSQETLMNNRKLAQEKRTEAKNICYKLKLKYERIKTIVDGMKKELEAREAKKDTYKLPEAEKESIGK